MRDIIKSSKLDHVAYDVRGPILDAASAMEEQGEKILKLNIGNPAPFGFRAPEPVVRAISEALIDSQGYSDSKGIPAARQAIIKYHTSKGIEGLSISDVYTGNGVSELITLSMQALLNHGDEILIPSPDYPLWTASATLAGGTVRHYVCDEASGWLPDVTDIRNKITNNTRGIVLINPNNPTGAVYPRALLQEIAELARKFGLVIFSDEIYDRLVMDGREHISIASICPDVFCVTLNGLSKSHLIAGYRCGWMVLSGDKTAARSYIEGLNMLSSMRLCSNVTAQYVIPAAMECLESTKPMIEPGGRIYEQRRAICDALDAIPGISYVKPSAAFYCFPKLDTERFGIIDDERFALDFLHDKKVLITHGRAFHWPDPDHFRIVYLPRIDVLNDSMKKLAEFLSAYRQN